MKKHILFVFLLSVLFLFGCTKTVEYQELKCEEMGYVPVDSVNKIINVTNQLVDITNLCFLEKNITPLNYLDYFD